MVSYFPTNRSKKMTVMEVYAKTQALQRFIIIYNRRISLNRIAEANIILINIKSLCDELQIDWQVLMNIKDGYLFRTVTEPIQSVTEPTQTDTETIQNDTCINCQKPLVNRRKDTKFCDNNCKTTYNRKKNDTKSKRPVRRKIQSRNR